MSGAAAEIDGRVDVVQREKSHRYPVDLIEVLRASDGERVTIRPVLPRDRDLIAAFFHGLSAEARCNRFLHPVSEPSSGLLRQLVEVDHRDHVALVAEIFGDGGKAVIAEARYVRAADPFAAEISLAVAQSWQGKGLAEFLLVTLGCRAAAAGLRSIIGETFAANEKALSLARKLGFAMCSEARGIVRLERRLPLPWTRAAAKAPGALSDTDAAL
jgi:acetyltransferase